SRRWICRDVFFPPPRSGGGGPPEGRWRGRRTQRDARVFVMSKHFRSPESSCEENLLQRQQNSESGAPSTTVRSLRELQWSPSPASRGRKVISFSRRRAPEFCRPKPRIFSP